jgi:predicted phage tail component-like protein
LYGFTFSGKHSYNDFGLITFSKNRPILPEPKLVSEDLPGTDGEYDYSMINPDEEVKYKPRTIEIDCTLKEPDQRQLRLKANKIAAWLACGEQKLIFDDEEHLFKMLGIGGKRYIDFYDIAKNNSDLFFKDNPFKIMNEIAEYKTNINYMDAIRNYIAHESHESKQCYIKKCLFDGIFIEPYVFLLKKNGTLSYFSNFVNNIKNIAKSLIEKPLE